MISFSYKLFLIFALSFIFITTSNAQNAAETAELEKKIEQLQQKITSLQAENQKLKLQLQQSRQLTEKAQKQAQVATDQANQAKIKAQKAIKDKESIEATQREFHLNTEYDEKSNTTNYTTTNSKVAMTHGASTRHHWLNFSASHKSKTPTNVKSINFHFQSFFTGKKYSKAKSVTLIVNNQTFNCPVTNYDNVPRRSAGRKPKRTDDESLTIQLSKPVILQLINTKSATGTIGPARFKLTHDQLSAIRTLARELKIQ